MKIRVRILMIFYCNTLDIKTFEFKLALSSVLILFIFNFAVEEMLYKQCCGSEKEEVKKLKNYFSEDNVGKINSFCTFCFADCYTIS